MFLWKGISESAESEAKKKRDKACQLSTRLGAARYSALKGAVSADGDGKHCSGVDDLARNETTIPGACFNFAVSYVVACSIWCLACIRKAEVGKIRKDIFLHEPPSREHQKTNS